jgi:hypothetical protein
VQLDLVGWGLTLRDWVVGVLTEKDVGDYGFVDLCEESMLRFDFRPTS